MQNMKKMKMKMKTYKEEISVLKKRPRTEGPISMQEASSSCLVDDKKLVNDMREVCAKGKDAGDTSVTASFAPVDFKSMKVKDKNFAQVLPGKATEVKFYPTEHMRMVVAGNNCGNIGFWKIDSNDDEHGIYVYHPHPAFISGISVQSSSLNKIISSCRDGFIRVFDIQKENFDLVYHSKDYPIFSIGRPKDDVNCVYLGEDRGGVSLLDIRMSKPSKTWSLHYDSINTIEFNPQDLNIMSTSSSDNTVCIWDLRKIDQDVCIKKVEHTKKVNSAYFSPSGSLLATTSMDDSLRIISGTSYDVEYNIIHPSYTSRFLSRIRGIWGWDDSFLMVANTKKRKGTIDVISTDTKGSSYTLESEHNKAILCRLDAHPLVPGVVAGATSGGKVYVWDI